MIELKINQNELDSLLTDKWDGKIFEDGISSRLTGYKLTRKNDCYRLRFFDSHRHDLIGEFVFEFNVDSANNDVLHVIYKVKWGWFLVLTYLLYTIFCLWFCNISKSVFVLSFPVFAFSRAYLFKKRLDPAVFLNFLESKTAIRPAKVEWWRFI